MGKAKKPVQEKIFIEGWNKEYVVQKLPALDAFMAREEKPIGDLIVYLIDNCIVHPKTKAEELEEPNLIRDLGVALMNYQYPNYDDLEEKEEKKSEEE